MDFARPDLTRLITERRRALEAEDGFGIIEVLVSAIIVAIISVATFTAIDAAGRTSDTNKARSVAASLAQDDLEELRSKKITELATLGANTPARTVTVDNRQYSIQSKGEYLAGTAGSDNCASDDEAPKYLKITSTVTVPSIPRLSPVVANSLRATPSGTIGDFGSLAVDINDRTGAGQAGIPVTITPDATAAANGGVTTTGTTNTKGCVLFGYIATGRYTVSFAKAGYVLAANPNAGSVSESAVVAADSIASKSYQYDQAGAAAVLYRTNNAYNGTTWNTNTNGTGFTIANASLGTPDFKTFTNTAATSATSPVVNFPFTGAYETWAGVCAGNRPPAAATGSLTVPKGAANVPSATAVPPLGVAREFRLRVQVQRRNSSSTTSTTNYATTPNDGRTVVRFTPTTPGCTDTVNATWVSNTGTSGGATAAYSTWEAIVPWGSYTVCAQYTNTTTNRAKDTETGVTTTTVAGTTYGTRLVIPYNLTSGYAC